jgi:hypothetical protein
MSQEKIYSANKTLRKIKNPLAYEVRKIQILIRQLDHKLSLDPGSVPIKEYIALLAVHTEKVSKLKKEGWPNEDNDKEGMAEVSGEIPEGTGKVKAVGVDSRVLPENPFAR